MIVLILLNFCNLSLNYGLKSIDLSLDWRYRFSEAKFWVFFCFLGFTTDIGFNRRLGFWLWMFIVWFWF